MGTRPALLFLGLGKSACCLFGRHQTLSLFISLGRPCATREVRRVVGPAVTVHAASQGPSPDKFSRPSNTGTRFTRLSHRSNPPRQSFECVCGMVVIRKQTKKDATLCRIVYPCAHIRENKRPKRVRVRKKIKVHWLSVSPRISRASSVRPHAIIVSLG